jgi:long-chain acyl-CoA synthetase
LPPFPSPFILRVIMNLAGNLERSAFFFSDRPAVHEDGRELTYRQLNEQSNRIAAGLVRMGIRPGGFIGMCKPNSADWISFYFWVLKTVAVTVSGLLTGDESALLVNRSRPRFIFANAAKLGDLESLRGSARIETIICTGGDLPLSDLMAAETGSFQTVDRDRHEKAAILYTGGTNGNPKGAQPLTEFYHALLCHEGQNWRRLHEKASKYS